MKKSILAVIGAALCLSLTSAVNVSASDVVDERFPEFAVLPTVIMPGDNSVHFVSNNNAVTGGKLKSFATFVSDAEYSLDELRAQYPSLPIDLASPAVQAELAGSDNIIISANNPQSIVTIMASETSSTLYYVLEFWDGTIEVQKVNFQNCIEEVGGRFPGLECRLSKGGSSLEYKAYVDGIEVSPEVAPTLPEDNSSNEEDSGQGGPSEAAVTPGKGDGTDGTNMNPDSMSEDKAENSYSNSENNLSNSAEQIASRSESTSIANTSNENVKNTKTDEETSSFGAPTMSQPSDTSSSSKSSPQSSIATVTALTDKSYDWWALLPLAFLAVGLVIFFFTKRKRITERKAQ